MFNKLQYPEDKNEAYKILITQANALIEKDLPLTTNLANISALLNQFLDNINWVGFYLYDGNELVLGPFQGLPACTTISLERGVCGAAGKNLETQLVKDVHAFPGHIACDGASKSEIVVPIYKDDKLYGVLDIDAPIYDRFDLEDKANLETLTNEVLLPLFE